MKYNKTNPLRCFFAFEGYNSQGMALKRLQCDYPDFDWVCVGRSEIDPSAIKAANLIFPESTNKNFGDISKIDWEKVPDFDLFTYSYPCTDISTAGKQAGLSEGSGTRSSLLWECRLAIQTKHPKYLLMENVKALVQKKFMPEFQKWMDWLAEQGYSNFWSILNAEDYGVPQHRERVFMFSILHTDNEPNPLYNFPKSFPLTKCVEDYMESAEDVDETYYVDQDKVTRKALSEILNQPHAFAEMEKVYMEEWQQVNEQYESDSL